MEVDRRTMLAGTLAMPFATEAVAAAAVTDDWERIAREYDVTGEIIQLEHGPACGRCAIAGSMPSATCRRSRS